MSGRVAEDVEVIEAARADASVQAEMDHPRIAGLRDFGAVPAGFYLVMAWLQGRRSTRNCGRDRSTPAPP